MMGVLYDVILSDNKNIFCTFAFFDFIAFKQTFCSWDNRTGCFLFTLLYTDIHNTYNTDIVHRISSLCVKSLLHTCTTALAGITEIAVTFYVHKYV